MDGKISRQRCLDPDPICPERFDLDPVYPERYVLPQSDTPISFIIKNKVEKTKIHQDKVAKIKCKFSEKDLYTKLQIEKCSYCCQKKEIKQDRALGAKRGTYDKGRTDRRTK